MNQYLDLLRRNRNYRFLWLASLITQLGDWFNLLASAELIANLSDSGVAISGLFLARFFPLFAFSSVAGVLADRYDRRHIMIATDLLRAATVLCFLFIRTADQLWLLYVLTALQFSMSALFTPARTAVLANIVPRSDLVTANALDGFTWSTMLAVGAFLGGLAAALFGLTTAFVLDAGTFLLSAWLIGRLAVTGTPRPAGGRAGLVAAWQEYLDGFRYLSGVPFILGISLAKGAGALVWGAINVLEISYANQIFPLDSAWLTRALRVESGGTLTLGLFYVITGLGTGIGPLLLRRWLGDASRRLLLAVTVGFGLLALGILGLAAAPTLALYSAATLVRTVGSGVIWVFSAALLQTIVPNQLRGRVFAFEFAFLTLTQSVSTLGAGLLQDSWGVSVRQTTAFFGSLGVVVIALWVLFLFIARSRIRALSAPEPIP